MTAAPQEGFVELSPEPGRSRVAPTARRRSAGQAMVEFALVFPLFLATMLVIFDTGRFIAAYSTLASSVQNGARVALICAVGASLSSACETAITSAVSTGVLSNTSPTITITQGTGPAGPNVTIAATMPHQIDPTFAALLGTTFVTTVTISHQATVTVAGPTP